MLVDDDIDFLEALEEVLVAALPNSRISSFPSSSDAALVIGDFDVIITDFRMPEVNGKVIIDKALALGKTKIFLVSGEFPEEILNDYSDRVSLVAKPLYPEKIESLVDQINSI